MQGTVLTIDLGNSRCKLRLWRAPVPARVAPLQGVDLDTGPQLGAQIEAATASWGGPAVATVALSSVATREVTSSLASQLHRLYGASFHQAPDCGLVNLCRPPEGVGRDRLYAARGALALAGRSAVVVDAGTALTVDALRVGDDGKGVFAGGAIAPGPRLLARSLASGGALLPSFEPAAGVPALGTSTEQAMRAGVAVGFRGAARELVERVAAEAGLRHFPVVLSGGARSFLLRPDPFTEREILVEEELVHLGLLHSIGAGE